MESRDSKLIADGSAWSVDGRAQALVGPGLATPRATPLSLRVFAITTDRHVCLDIARLVKLARLITESTQSMIQLWLKNSSSTRGYTITGPFFPRPNVKRKKSGLACETTTIYNRYIITSDQLEIQHHKSAE